MESTGVEWWPLVIGMLWKRNRKDRDERDKNRDRDISVMRREKK